MGAEKMNNIENFNDEKINDEMLKNLLSDITNEIETGKIVWLLDLRLYNIISDYFYTKEWYEKDRSNWRLKDFRENCGRVIKDAIDKGATISEIKLLRKFANEMDDLLEDII